jgi:Gamma-glutamyl cyclotransferase, AIG2-like
MLMEPRRITVFFYGLFMDVELLRASGARPVQVRSACVPGFALRLGRRATLIPNAETSVYGIVMELSHAEIEKLYSDVSLSAYRPEAVLAQLADGSYISVLCFNLIVPPSPEEVNSEYAVKLRELARRLKLPLGYVESIH